MSNYDNLRYMGIYRTSSNLQSENSIPDQTKIVHDCAAKNNMIHAGGDVIQSGISASKRRGREDIEALIERKKAKNDFDVIVIHDYSRLTRRGVLDAFEIEQKLNKNGIQVLSATEQIPDGPYRHMVKAVIHEQHKQYVRDSAQRIARGQMSSILQRRSIGPTQIPYGIDRLYVSLSTGKKHHILRSLPDGSQVRMHPETGEVLSYYERVEGEKPRHYRKQPDERVTFIKGDKKLLDVVRRIFQLVVVDGMGYHNVARTLHKEGLPSPQLGAWHKATIKRIVSNPVYTGRLIVNRLTRAEFCQRSKDGPVTVPESPVNQDAEKSLFHRPPSDWVTLDLPDTADILDPKLREMAIAYQDGVLTHNAELANRGIKRDKYSTSSFFLKDVLRLKHDGSLMCGMIANNLKTKGKIYRYYRPRGYGTVANVGTVRTMRIPAEPLEALVLDILSQIFVASPDLYSNIKALVVKEQAGRHETKTKAKEMEK